MITATFGEYGSRDFEGDPNWTPAAAGTMGLAGTYGRGRSTTLGGFDQYRGAVDLGFRDQGISLQAEGYYQGLKGNLGDPSTNDYGFYVQGGYFLSPKAWEIALRY